MIVPFELKPESKVLVSGCGGGFDVVAALPIGLALEKAGHEVVYSSFSFSSVPLAEKIKWITDKLMLVDGESALAKSRYFPEKYLCEWYHQKKGIPQRVYCYSVSSISDLTEIFDHIKNIEMIDYHFVVDGGSDGILRGDEFDLGTPDIDATSVIAASKSTIERGYYVLTAFGTEGANKSVRHAEVLERMSELICTDDMAGVSSILNDVEIKDDFLDAVSFIFARNGDPSTIVGSMTESLKGKCGDRSFNWKTVLAPVWVSPLTSLLWFFSITGVADNKLYYDDILEAKEVFEIDRIISRFWSSHRTHMRKDIPI
jgi:hypothetical protein